MSNKTFPSANYLIAIFDKVENCCEKEFKVVANNRQLKSIKNWHLAGIVDNSSAVESMELVRVFYNITTGEILESDMFSDYVEFQAKDAMRFLTYNENENIENILYFYY